MSTGAALLQSTYHGHVATTNDALVLFEACLSGQLSHVPRRPHDRERNSLIRSGCIFIYEENASGIKRWTDGVTWSPSRILGNFLVYRELDKPFPPGEKKRAMKKNNRRATRPGDPYPRPDTNGGSYSPTTPQSNNNFGNAATPTDAERQLIGSLIDSYGFKPNGLVKKTMSVTVQGVTHHLVSYYNMDDVINRQLQTPSDTSNLRGVRPRPELTSKQSFRAPLEEQDDTLEGARDGSQGLYAYRPLGAQNNYYPGSNNPYHPTAAHPQHGHHQPGMPSPYSVGGSGGLSGNFVPQMGTPQMPQRDGEYGGYGQSTYNRNYDSLHTSIPTSSHTKSIPPTPTSAISSTFPDRPPLQPHNNAGMYPPPSDMQPRAGTAPSPIDSRAHTNYNRGSYSMPNIIDPNRAPYYATQSSYQPVPPISHWQTSAAGGQTSI